MRAGGLFFRVLRLLLRVIRRRRIDIVEIDERHRANVLGHAAARHQRELRLADLLQIGRVEIARLIGGRADGRGGVEVDFVQAAVRIDADVAGMHDLAHRHGAQLHLAVVVRIDDRTGAHIDVAGGENRLRGFRLSRSLRLDGPLGLDRLFRLGGLVRLSRSFRISGFLRLSRSFRISGLLRLGRSFRIGGFVRLGRGFRVSGLLRLGRSFRISRLLRPGRSFRISGLLRIGGLVRFGRSFRVSGFLRIGRSFRIGGLLRLGGLVRHILLVVAERCGSIFVRNRTIGRFYLIGGFRRLLQRFGGLIHLTGGSLLRLRLRERIRGRRCGRRFRARFGGRLRSAFRTDPGLFFGGGFLGHTRCQRDGRSGNTVRQHAHAAQSDDSREQNRRQLFHSHLNSSSLSIRVSVRFLPRPGDFLVWGKTRARSAAGAFERAVKQHQAPLILRQPERPLRLVCLFVLKEQGQGQIHAGADLRQRADRRHLFPAADLTDVRLGNACLRAQCFLGDAGPVHLPAQHRGNTHPMHSLRICPMDDHRIWILWSSGQQKSRTPAGMTPQKRIRTDLHGCALPQGLFAISYFCKNCRYFP